MVNMLMSLPPPTEININRPKNWKVLTCKKKKKINFLMRNNVPLKKSIWKFLYVSCSKIKFSGVPARDSLIHDSLNYGIELWVFRGLIGRAHVQIRCCFLGGEKHRRFIPVRLSRPFDINFTIQNNRDVNKNTCIK